MGAADELHAHRRGFGPQHPGKDPIHHFTSLVTVAVAGEGSEMLSSQPLGRESLQHPLQPLAHGRRPGRRQALLLLGHCLHQRRRTVQAVGRRLIQLVHAYA